MNNTWINLSQYRDADVQVREAIQNDALALMRYAKYFRIRLNEEEEQVILTNLSAAFVYANDVIKGRWAEFEKIALKSDPNNAEAMRAVTSYAVWCMKSRWLEMEPFIARYPSALLYVREVIKGRWLEAEPAIANSHNAYAYAIDIIKGPWKEAEKWISENPIYALPYAEMVIKGRWEICEEGMLQTPQNAFRYALNVIKGPWKEAEPIIATDASCAYKYATNVLKGPFPLGVPIMATAYDPVSRSTFGVSYLKFLKDRK